MQKRSILDRKGVFVVGVIILIILLIFVGFFIFKGITGNAILANYLNTNYAPPYNSSNSSDYFFTISSNSLVAINDVARLTANVSMKGGYIYQKGYVYNQRTLRWEVFNFAQSPVENSYWIKDFASKDLVINVSNNIHNSSETYIVAYACQKINNSWQCGCQSASEIFCKRWMLHKFNITNITVSPDVRCTSDANCTVVNGTCNKDSGLCVTENLCISNCSCAATTAVGEKCINSCNKECPGEHVRDGTLSYPFAIYNWTGLNNMRNNLIANYTLMRNLTSSDGDYIGVGNSWQPIGSYSNSFVGNFNGNGKTISNLITSNVYSDGAGLFAFSNGKISNIGLIDARVRGTSTVGGLVGYSAGVINNSYVIGNITGINDRVGGLVGWQANYGVVSNSFAKGNVNGMSTMYTYVGGLVGYLETGTISNSYATGNITGVDYVGGLVGAKQFMFASISNSYAAGRVVGNSLVGGLVGGYFGDSFSFTYWDNLYSGQTNMCGLSSGPGCDNSYGKNTTQMENISMFISAGWDTNIWKFLHNYYPSLEWENKPCPYRTNGAVLCFMHGLTELEDDCGYKICV